MLPEYSSNPMIAEKLFEVRRNELMREFQDVRLLGAAGLAKPSLALRFRMWIAGLFRSGKHVDEQYVPATRQSYIDAAIRLAP